MTLKGQRSMSRIFELKSQEIAFSICIEYPHNPATWMPNSSPMKYPCFEIRIKTAKYGDLAHVSVLFARWQHVIRVPVFDRRQLLTTWRELVVFSSHINVNLACFESRRGDIRRLRNDQFHGIFCFYWKYGYLKIRIWRHRIQFIVNTHCHVDNLAS